MEIIIGIVFVILILLLTGLDIGWVIMGIAGLTADNGSNLRCIL